MTDAVHNQLARVVRENASQLAASLIHVTGDFATAEDLVQDAVLAALRHWPADGIPERPDSWLFTVARRRGLDVLRREHNYVTKLAQLQWPVQPEPDERLRLIFTCCHPALPRQAQIALTLRVVCGLTTPQIARAFLVHETTMAQRITRAKQKIKEAEIPYRIPDRRRAGPAADRGPRRDLSAVQRGLPVDCASGRRRATSSKTPSGWPRCSTS